MRDRILAKLRMPDGTINPWVIAVTVTLATFMEVLDTSIANVALPHIAGNLSAGQDESTWVLTSYLVSNAIVLPLSGWFSGLIGRKRFYMTCVAIFTLSSFLCGLAPSLGVLVIFRIMQGVGGGGLQPSEQAILNDTFPLEKRGMAFAVYGLAVVVAPTIGPWLGGWITDNFSWRWIFYINVPVGIISLILTNLLISDPPYMKRASVKSGFRIDYIGIGLISLGLGSMQIILDKGQREDWLSSNFIRVFFVLMVFGLIAGILCMMPVVGILVSRVDTRILVTFGCIVSASALFVMAGWDLGLDYGHAVRARMLQSFGLAVLFIPINVSAFAYVPKEKTNMGTGIINLARNIGASVGIATVTTMLDRRAQFHQSRLMEHVNGFSAAYHNSLNGMQAKLIAAGSTAVHASAQAHGMIYNTVQRQAVMLAFIDNFKMLGVVFFAVIPILALMRKPRVPAGGAPVH